MWIVVYVTQLEETADKLCEKFARNDIISKIRRTEGGGFEVLVPQAELSEAQDLIFELE